MLASFLALALAAPGAPDAPRCASFDLSLAGIGSLEEDLARVAQLAGASPLWPGLLRRPSGARPLLLCDGPAPRREDLPDPAPPRRAEWTLVPPASFSRLHSGWADDRNDGAMWSGRGLSTAASGGVRVRWGWLTAQAAPLVAWQQNASWFVPASTLPGYSPYANPFNGGVIDLPIRKGPGAFTTFDPGQSYVRADAWNLAVGLSTENLWWGPGIRNSLLMSNSAPGFPHLFAGTTRPLDVWIGWLEVEAIWGWLRPSRYFDGATGNRPLFESQALTFAPAFQPNLTLGIARVYLYPGSRVAGLRYLNPLVPPFLNTFAAYTSNNTENQLASIFFRWAFPEVQLEIYGEWGRDDFAFNLQDFLEEPGHSQAYLLGLQKLFPAGNRWIRLQLELTHTFEMPPNNPTRGTPIFYTHGAERQGYTNAGQMLGAGLGPQGDTQLAAVDWFRGAGSWGFYVERIVRNERWFYDHVVAATEKPRHDLEMSVGARGAWAFREWDLQWELGGAHRYAPNFGKPLPGVEALLRLAWWPGREAPPVLPPRRRETASALP